MQVTQDLKPISAVELTKDEHTILSWIRSANWEPAAKPGDTEAHKAKVPEFFNGVRLYKVQAGAPGGAGSMGPLDVFIKKIEFFGVIMKQELYPVITEGNAKFLILRQPDLDNLGVGSHDEDDEDY